MEQSLVLRNVKIAGQRTSMRLEPEYWRCLEEIAKREDYTINEILTELKKRISNKSVEANNLHSATRVYCLSYFLNAVTEEGLRKASERHNDIFTGTPFQL